MKALSIAAVQASRAILTRFGRGGSLPGEIGLKLDKNIFSKLKINAPVILVTGTNGKTSTANLITSMFEMAGYLTISNRKGDNLKAGIATALLGGANLGGKIKADAVVLEVDELNVRHVLPYLPVSALVVTNFFRDQLDRAREMEQLIESIESVLPAYTGTLILNGNDPNTVRLKAKAPNASVLYYGLEKNAYSKTETSEASEGKFCPNCGHRLGYEYYQYSHIGSFYCDGCGFSTPRLDTALYDIDLKTRTFWCNGLKYRDPYHGLYSMYNCAALLCTASCFHIEERFVREVLLHAPQPAGRNERFLINDIPVILNLIKNPTGANEVMKVIETDETPKNIVIVLNDHEQDGRDVSWIYDTFFEKVLGPNTGKIVAAGTRAADMALRIYYEGWQDELKIADSIEQAVEECLEKGRTLYVIATYTALLDSRNAILKEKQA